jgi:hypothetical protein
MEWKTQCVAQPGGLLYIAFCARICILSKRACDGLRPCAEFCHAAQWQGVMIAVQGTVKLATTRYQTPLCRGLDLSIPCCTFLIIAIGTVQAWTALHPASSKRR